VNNHLDVHLITFITSIHSSLLTYESSANDILKEICLTIKSLCTHDDLRKEMSCAYDNGKRFLNDDVVSALVNYSRNYQKNADVSACALSALRQLILSEEAVKMVCSHGLMTLPKQILQLDHAPVILIRSLVGLIRNICADDGRKNYLVSDGIVPLLIFYMSREEYQLDSQLMEHIFATLAAIALRYPNNSHLIVTSGGIEEIVSIMRRYEQKASLQRQACLTIRNIASRCPELRRRILDCNVEVMLRHAGRHQECIDEAYAALRDLECEVQYVKLSTDGKGYESAYETFGTSKPKFNPVFEETYDIITRIDKEATAPFANPHGSSRLDEDDDNDDELEGHGNHHQHSDTCCH
jgi:armadillo repeat-containing protein 6